MMSVMLRVTRAALAAVICTAAVSALSPAEAQSRRRTLESDRTRFFELKVGPYQPRIDSEFQVPAGANPGDFQFPYQGSFGDASPLMYLGTYEFQIFNRAGTLSSGITLGYWQVSGTNGSLDPNSDASEETGIQMIPIQAGFTYRLDQMRERIPLVPTVRLGFDYYLWRVTRGDGEVARFANGSKAEGATMGWHAGIGVHFLLDFLAPTMASDFDRDAGVNNSYLTFDYQYTQVDDFGSASSLRLGDSTFFVGLALDL
ncbi:MAG: MXAN_2562 family outer membrane beta-barrel protein [Bradymonadia bacterium]